MPNDVLSSGSSLRTGNQPGSRQKDPHRESCSAAEGLFEESRLQALRLPARGRFANTTWLSGALCLLAGLSLGCGSDDKGLTYAKSVRPILNQRCTICHRPGGPSGVDIQNPFSSPEGLAISKNGFKLKHPELPLPEYNVVAGDPDNSFLMYKIDDSNRLPPDPDQDGPLEAPAGMHMPLGLPPLLFEQVHVIEEWVKAGAPLPDVMFADPGAPAAAAVPGTDELAAIPAHDAVAPQMRTFNKDIRPIIGTEDDLSRTLSATGGVCTPTATKTCPRCIYCHYEDGPNLPDLTDVYDPVAGLVNATAKYRSDMKRVDPFHPENSLLIQKLHYENFNSGVARSDFGAQMPYSFPDLSRTQVETVRQWIQEGAKP
jgi:hypothetical protein